MHSPPPTPGPSSLQTSTTPNNEQSKLRRNRRPSRLTLDAPSSSSSQQAGILDLNLPLDSRPSFPPASEAAKSLSSTLRGTPRRRPSMPFKKPQLGLNLDHIADPESAKGNHRPPEAYRDPSEHILSGKGSTLQHARSVYSQGPVEILPGLFLGDEHNACDNQMLSRLGITTILNVAKETVLPFQLEQSASSSSSSKSLAPEWAATPRRPGSAARSTSLLSAVLPEVGDSLEQYYTPPTTSLPTSADLRPSQLPSPLAAIGTSLLRNTSSTPNLLTHFQNNGGGVAAQSSLSLSPEQQQAVGEGGLRQYTPEDVLQYRSVRRPSSSSSDDAFGSPCSSRAASTCTSATTDLSPPSVAPSLANTDHAFDTSAQQHWVTQVELPSNAIAIRVPASPHSSRPKAIRYIKLPWTHDETDLSTPDGGFTQGCALIAEVLGLDPHVWVAAKIPDHRLSLPSGGGSNLAQIQTGDPGGRVLVHCQCGVSRSATLVIAFVMQAAAMRFGFTETQGLMGMHDCYNMVKEKSASISPNISLIYQLVEWERHLSNAARRLRDAESADDNAAAAHRLHPSTAAGWSTETMDEAMWSKMRLEEEEKEAAEEARRRDQRLAETNRLNAQRKASEDNNADTSQVDPTSSLLQRRRKKAAPALQLQTTPQQQQSDTPKRRPAVLQLGSDAAVETPFHTAYTVLRNDGDVEMHDVEPPCTPLPKEADAELLDPACTPTANKSSSGEALRTPSSLAPPPRIGSLSASLNPAFHFGTSTSRNGIKSSIPPTTSSNTLFGVTALSQEERRKQHRRTFSSDWPSLPPTSAAAAPLPPRRGSRLADSIDLLSADDTSVAMDE